MCLGLLRMVFICDIIYVVMTMEEKYQQRKPTRIRKYDYSSAGAYFVTICTQDRKRIMSEIISTNDKCISKTNENIVGGDVLDAPFCIKLLPYGVIAEKYIKQLDDFYNNIKIDHYIIMPDHIHIMIFVYKSGASRTSPPTRQHSIISRFVSTFKRFCNKEYGENIWQESFYDHIIRNDQDYEEHIKYIYENPIKWYYKNK